MFNFIKEAKAELDKVTWPSRDETIRLTVIVVLISILAGLYLGGLDIIFTEMLKILIS